MSQDSDNERLVLDRSRMKLAERRRRLGIPDPDENVLRELAEMDEIDYQPEPRL